MSCDDSTYWADRLTAAKAALEAYEAAELAFVTDGSIQEYSIDTGQSVVKVTRSNMTEIRRSIHMLSNRVATLSQRVNGCNTRVFRPGW